ncbi:hypothetical protein BV898_19550 [Hypsibius exemplaris]|uniref:Uncharacterized protein n=1 Tax=Hypsibius exemplaris TaxID=2072580 RepID=A0A9X6NLW3_HYPEX|nr:hypothetical protein BV898_19550 [Hypsibius exemplaris]
MTGDWDRGNISTVPKESEGAGSCCNGHDNESQSGASVKTYIGSCNDDDVACAQSCADENLISGKCEPIPKNGLIRACFCQGSAGLVVAVTATTTKPKPCIGNYEGSCIDDDEACAQSCAADNLTGEKCGQYGKSGSTRICYCQGCAGTTPEPTVAEATTTSTTSISSIVWPSYLQPGPRRTCEDAVISGQDCRTCTTSTDNGTSTWKQQCLTREPDFEDPVAATSRPCEIIVNHQGLSCTRCYTVSGLRTNWNEQCLPSPATSVRQSDNPSPEANDRQCRELKKGTQTCTHCTWLENGRSRWKEDCR